MGLVWLLANVGLTFLVCRRLFIIYNALWLNDEPNIDEYFYARLYLSVILHAILIFICLCYAPNDGAYVAIIAKVLRYVIYAFFITLAALLPFALHQKNR